MSVVCTKIRDRLLYQNKNALVLMAGETGSGKSISSMAIGHEIDPSLTLENLEQRIARSTTEFIELSNSMSKGQVLIWDEAGIGLSAAEWWKRANILINYVLQTFRHENICVIFTAPTTKDIDPKARTRFHYYMEPQGIDFIEQIATVKVRRWQHNAEIGKTYSKRIVHKEGRHELAIAYLEVPLPPAPVVEKYESIMKPWKKNVKESVRIELDELARAGKQAASEMDLIKDVITQNKLERILSRRKSGKRFVDGNLIAVEYGVGATKARRVARYLEKNVLRKEK